MIETNTYLVVTEESEKETKRKIEEGKLFLDEKCEEIAKKLFRKFGAYIDLEQWEYEEAMDFAFDWFDNLPDNGREKCIYATLRWHIDDFDNRREYWVKGAFACGVIETIIFEKWALDERYKSKSKKNEEVKRREYQNPRAVFFRGGIPGLGKRS